MSGKDAPMYYDPETGEATFAATLAATPRVSENTSSEARMELARLERERDDALRERDDALRTVRDIERMPEGCGVRNVGGGIGWCPVDMRRGQTLLLKCAAPTLALCVAAWAKANPEQEGK